MSVHALILAGGEGARLGGVRKADLRIGGQRLADRVAERLRGADSLLVATGPGAVRDPGVGTSLSDGEGPHGGPMAGLAAAMRHLAGRSAPEDLLIMAAVDTPFLPVDYLSRMIAALETGPAAHAAWGGMIYPTNSAWRMGALLPIAHLPDSPKALLKALGAAQVEWTDAANPFANVNGLSDLISLSRRALAADR